MHIMASRGARVVRGMLAAGTSILVAALAHMAGGGPVPGTLGVALAAAFSVPASVLLAGKSVSTLRLTVSVLTSQGAFHTLFSLGAATSSTVRLTGDHHGMGGYAVLDTGSASTAGMETMSGMHMSGGMWIAHAAAALLTLVALRHGEQAFWDLVALARTGLRAVLLLALVLAPHPDQPRHRVPVATRMVPQDLGVLLVATPHRGPPVAA